MRVFVMIILTGIFFMPGSVLAADARDAKALLKENACAKCHSVSKKKGGPPYKEIAKKYKNDPEAEAKLYKRMTTSSTFKVEGKEEKHKNIEAESDDEIKNLVQWILSL